MEKASSDVQIAQTPLLRVYLFGEFQLVWQVASFTEETVWNSRTSARTLCKLLLCMPGRQATKSLLAGILWPETDEEKARESLRSAHKVLRKVLRTASGEELIGQRNDDTILKLVDQSHLWVDADAFEDLIAQASRATTPDEALLLWQEAKMLLHGEFLADDQSSEWISHRLVKQRKQALWMARCRLIRHLADYYIQRGQLNLAEETLEQHIVRFPTDQDALSRLLLLLEQQGYVEQACMLYERTRRILESAGKQPVAHLKTLYARLQKSIPSLSSIFPPQTGTARFGGELERTNRSHLSASSGVIRMEQKHANTELIHALPSLLTADWLLESVFDSLRSMEKSGGIQAMPAISRRQLLELGIAALIGRLAQLDSKCISAIEREELGKALGESVAAGWKLFSTAGNSEVLAVGQLQLSLIHQVHAFITPSSLPYLYTGAYGLVGIALHLQDRNEEALPVYHNGYIAALAIHDPIYVARNLICQADTYLVLGRYAEALQALEETLSYLGNTNEEHRRLKAHLLGCWADVAMTMREYNLAQRKLDEAAHYLDKVTLTEEFDRTCWLQLAGKKALMAGDYQLAIDHLEEALGSNPPHWLVRQAGILTPLAVAYARMQEREQSLLIARQAIPVIGAVNASMTNKYFLEYLRDDILGRFPHDNKMRSFLAETQQMLPHLSALVDVS